KEVFFDLGGLEYISSAGLRILMTAHKAMSAAGGGVKVCHANAMVCGVFEITGLSSVFVIEP
ncbi:MAG: STAS domain-containing protein, partial [Kiritimatiellae bacterium]|nr:STAS domain-containing protein [Kiritimatiellia bacterium]